VNVKCVVSDDYAGPYLLHQIIFCDELTPCLSQGLDDLECSLPKDYGCALAPKLTSAEVKLPRVACVDQIWRCCGHLRVGRPF